MVESSNSALLFCHEVSYTNMEGLRELHGRVVFPAERLRGNTFAIQLTTRTTRHTWPTQCYTPYILWVVVKIMVLFGVPIIIRHLIFWVPKKDHNFDIHPYEPDKLCRLRGQDNLPGPQKYVNNGLYGYYGFRAIILHTVGVWVHVTTRGLRKTTPLQARGYAALLQFQGLGFRGLAV